MTHQAVLKALCAQAWQLAALALLIGLIARIAARNRPHLAHALWLVVLLKCVTPPVWDSPVGVFSWLPPTLWDAGDESTAPTTRGADVSGVTVTIAEFANRVRPRRAVEPEPANRNTGRTLTAEPVAARLWRSGRFERAVIAIWLVGAGLIGLLAVARVASCWRRLRRSAPESHPELEKMLSTLAIRLRLRHGARLWVHGSRVGPAVMGLWRPVVLLPSCVVQGRSAAQLEPILAHELIHIRRGDLWVGLFQTIAQAIWWFHPLVWLTGRMISREAERSCDEEVLGELGCDPSSYARSLLGVLELKRTLIPAPAVPGVRVVDITSQRLERIMTLGQGCRRRTPWWCWMVMLVAAVLALPGSPLNIRATEPAAAEVPAVGDSPAVIPTKLPQQAAAGEFPPEREGDTINCDVGPAGETTGVYRVSDVLAKIEDQAGVDRPAAKRLLWTRLRAAQRDPEPLVPAITTPIASVTEPAKEHDPPAYWTGDTLVIQQLPEHQRKTSAVLEEVRKLGIDMLEIEICFLTSPLKVMTDASQNWTTLPMLAGAGTSGVPSLSLPAADAAAGVATFSVEKSLPVILDVLDDTRARKLIDGAKAGWRTSILQAPKVRLFNGQAATVTDCTQTAFLVGFKEGKPQIRVVREGINVLVRPLLDGERARLQFEILSSGIREVDEFKVHAPDGSPTTIEVPEVAQVRVASTIDVPLGQTAFVGGLKELGLSKKYKNAQSLGVLFSVKKVSAKDAHSPAAVADKPSSLIARHARPQETTEGRGVAGDAGLVGKLAGDAQEVDGPLITQTYAAADLVVQVPNPTIVPWDEEAGKEPAPPAKIDYNSLIDLIVTTVRPESWDTAGGAATVQPFPRNLSLVILQTDSGHEEVAKLFEQLRKLRRVKACLEIRPVNDALKVCEVLGIDPARLAVERFLPIAPEQAQRLIQADNIVATGKRVELFNGQRAETPMGAAAGFFRNGMVVSSTICNDQRSVRLQIQGLGADKQAPPVITMTLGDGHSMLVDVSAARTFPSSGQKYVLFTPRIIVPNAEDGKAQVSKQLE